nr:Chain C, COLLAGEN TRIPLE HELIX [synthetic construct]
PPGPPGP